MGLLGIEKVAQKIGLKEKELTAYGKYMAKVDYRSQAGKKENGKLILVTAITPTPAGEGKTTTSIGLGEAFAAAGLNAIVCLRQPSMGPVFGMKGGATGGGCSSIEPKDKINMHFTGDMHAIGAANNLLAAAIDNHIEQGNELGIEHVVWRRAIDMNDRALREIVCSPHGKVENGGHKTGFDITAASEVMAAFCLSKDLMELRERLGNIIVGFDKNSGAVFAKQLGVNGAMAAVLSEAFNPNLVQSAEGTPVFVHGGPFANIAHGCSSLVATKLALRLADYVITEAGFGSDLGAEKFFDIKCRVGGLQPKAAVIVVTLKALKMHGGVQLSDILKENEQAVRTGLSNLEAHIENIEQFGVPVIVAINKFHNDSAKEFDIVIDFCKKKGVECGVMEVFEGCGIAGVEFAKKIAKCAEKKSSFKQLYKPGEGIREKIEIISKRVYGAEGVDFLKEAVDGIKRIEGLGFGKLPVCIAKTQFSLSDNPKLLGRPNGFRVAVRAVKVSAGAGFVVAYSGTIMTMPGLPKEPNAKKMDIDKDGKITGIS